MENLYCSFCGKKKDFVEHLVVAKDFTKDIKIGICNECIELTYNLLQKRKEEEVAQ